MTKDKNPLSEQLEQICRFSGARWAVWMAYEGERWDVSLPGRLRKAQLIALQKFINDRSTNTWLSGSLNTGRVRSRSTGTFSQQLGCEKVFTFSDYPSRSILLVGADGLTKDRQTLFRIFAKNGSFVSKKVNGNPMNDSSIQHLQELKILYRQELSLIELAEATVGVQDATEVIDLVIRKLADIFGTERVSVFLRNADPENLREFVNPFDPSLQQIPEDTNLAAYVIEVGDSLRLGYESELSRLNYHNPDIQSVLAVPLKTPSKTIGAFLVKSEKPRFFTLQDEYLLMVIASQVAGILINLDVYHQTQAHTRNLELIHQVIKNIVGQTDETEVAQLTADLMAEYFGYEFTVIMAADESAQNLKILGIGGTKADLLEKGIKFPITKGIIGRVFRTGESFVSNDISNDPDYFSILSWKAGSEICVPLREGEKIIGVINLERAEKGFFTVTDQIVIEALAGILSSVMMSAVRYKQLNNKVSQLQAVRETSLDLSANLDLDLLFKRVVHRVRELVGANGAEIGLVEDEQLGIRVQTSENPWYDFTGHFIPIGKGVAGKVLQLGSPVRVTDYYSWSDRLWPGTQVEFKAAAGVPLKLKGKVIGTLVVMDDQEGREFSIDDINTLQMIAQNIAYAIHNAQLYKDLNESIEAKRQTENMLVQSERMAAAGRLTASIAHEINNPLQALQNCLYLADHAELSTNERQKYLTMARSELERLNTTVQRMLDYYRPGAKDRQLTDLNEMIGRIVELIIPQLEKNGILVETDLEPKIPRVIAVPSQIQQVVLNLLLNAMEAMPNGGKIFISTTPCSEMVPGNRVRKSKKPVGVEIFIRDTGPGVSLENKEQIFEPFISTKKNGIGLGLSVSYGIIQAHGGTLDLLSDNGPGACFRIALPLEVEQ